MKNLLYTFTLLFSGLMAQSQTPAITMTTTTAIGSTFSFDIGANADNTAIQVDWGNSTLTDYTIGTGISSVSGTLSGNTIKVYGVSITILDIQSRNLTALDISGATALKDIYCTDNNLTTLDVSENTMLNILNCNSNQLTALDVSKNTALICLYCNNNKLTTLDVSKNSEMIVFCCSDNQLSTLDVSMNTALTELSCEVNKLTSLDVSKNTALTVLYCWSNQLTTIDMTHNTALKYLCCESNQLITLDVTKNTALTLLWCSSNQLSSLDVSNNTALTYLSCSSNQLTFSTLPIIQPTYTAYAYIPQASLKLPKKNYTLSEAIDLSSQLTANGNTTTYTWKTEGGTMLASGVDYTATNGVFTFLKAQTDSVYCQMTNATFPNLTLYTTNAKITQFPSSVDETSLAVNIYPNPVSESLNIELTENITRVEVFTITGVKVFEVAGSNTNTARIPTADLPKGVLIVKVYGRRGVMERKIVKE